MKVFNKIMGFLLKVNKLFWVFYIIYKVLKLVNDEVQAKFGTNSNSDELDSNSIKELEKLAKEEIKAEKKKSKGK